MLHTDQCEISYSFRCAGTTTVSGQLRPLGGHITLSPHGHLQDLGLVAHLGSLTADPPARSAHLVQQVVIAAGGEVIFLRSRRICPARGYWYAVDGELVPGCRTVPVRLAVRLLRVTPSSTLVLLEGAANTAVFGARRPRPVLVAVTAEFGA